MTVIMISQITHTHLVNFLIDKYKMENFVIVVLYTSVNIHTVVKKTYEIIDPRYYNNIKFVKLPRNPLRMTYSVIKSINKTYSKLFKELSPSTVFMFSRDRHYSLFIEIAKKMGTELVYVEEGMSTYAPVPDIAQGFVLTPVKFVKEMKNAISSSWKGTLMAELFSYPFRIYKTLLSVYKSRTIQIWIVRNSKLKKYFDLYPEFNRAIVSHPSLAKETINATSYEQLDKVNFRTSGLTSLVSDKNYLFLSQKFFSQKMMEKYYKIVFSLLVEIAYRDNATIYIKLHPKEELATIINFFPDDKRVKILETSQVSNISAESLIMEDTYNFENLFSISSSTLLYAKNLKPDLKIFSISRALITLLKSEGFTNADLLHFNDFSENIIPKFPEIKEYRQHFISA